MFPLMKKPNWTNSDAAKLVLGIAVSLTNDPSCCSIVAEHVLYILIELAVEMKMNFVLNSLMVGMSEF